MPHLNNQPHDYDQTASAYILREFDGQLKVYLHWHKKLNRWLQFGGHIEANENVWQAVLHEIREESGYDQQQLRVLQAAPPVDTHGDSSNLPTPFNVNAHKFLDQQHYHCDSAFLMIVDQDPAHERGVGESEILKWFTLQELEALSEHDLHITSLQIIRSAFDLAKQWRAYPASEYTSSNP